MKDYQNDGKDYLENLEKINIEEHLERQSQEQLQKFLEQLEQDDFEVTTEEVLADGLFFKSLERGCGIEGLTEQKKCVPADYTSDSARDENGMFHPGQLEWGKLTDKALEKISGDPLNEIPLWSEQLEQNSCAVNAQKFVINALKDTQYSEEELIQVARDLNLYHDFGTVPADVGRLAEAYGLECEQIQNSSLEELERIHDAGGKTIVTINSMKLAYPELFGFYRADHAVQVVGIDRNDPNDIRVILNDPGREDGAGLSVPKDIFMNTWNTGNRFVAAIYPEVTR